LAVRPGPRRAATFMWPHELEFLYQWYATLPATVVLFGCIVAIAGARGEYVAADERVRSDVKFRFDETDAVLLGPLLWLFFFAVSRFASWMVGGFSTDSRIAVFYSFYGLVSAAVLVCLCVLLFFQPSMRVADAAVRVFHAASRRVDRFYNTHATRWYFVLPLAMTAASVIYAESIADFAYCYKWYYIVPTILFFYALLLYQWLGACDVYADEHSSYYLRRAASLSRWLSLTSLLIILWMCAYLLLDIEGGTTQRVLYAPTVLYGALVWAACALLAAWSVTLLMAAVYGLPWIIQRKLVRHLQWAELDEKSKICYRIRKLGGEDARRCLTGVLNDPAAPLASRLAAAWELTECSWSPSTPSETALTAIATNQWSLLRPPQPAHVPVLLDVLDRTLHTPRTLFDQSQLSLVTAPVIDTLGRGRVASALMLLQRAVQLEYLPDEDEIHVPGVPDDENLNHQEVVNVRCAAARALADLGHDARPAVPLLESLAGDDTVPREVREATRRAVDAICDHDAD